MNELCNTALENLNTPIIICSKQGKILYKNRIARRMLPHPKAGGNIHKYVYAKNDENKHILICSVINHDSFIRNAAVVEDEQGNEIWFFYLPFQIADPEDFMEDMSVKTAESAVALRDFVTELSAFGREDALPADRCARLCDYLYTALGEIHHTRQFDNFGLYDIVQAIKETAEELIPKFWFRVTLNTDFIDPAEVYSTSFRNFASVFVQILMIMLRMSMGAEVKINMTQAYSDVHIEYLAKAKREGIGKCVPDSEKLNLEYLKMIFPDYRISFTPAPTSRGYFGFKVDLILNDFIMPPLRCPMPDTDGRDFEAAKLQIRRFFESLLQSENKKN